MKNTKINREDKLFQDLFRLGDYSAWVDPKQPENIEWFNKQFKATSKKSFQDGDLLKLRMKELVDLGATIENKTYFVANINRSDLLDYAYELGADPNYKGKTGLSVCYRAMSRGRTDIVRSTISQPSFDVYASVDGSGSGENILLASLKNGRVDLAKDIIGINNDLVFKNDTYGKSPLQYLGNYLYNNTKASLSKAMSIANIILDIQYKVGSFPLPNTESNDLNTFISEKNAVFLSTQLPIKNLNDPKGKMKL